MKLPYKIIEYRSVKYAHIFTIMLISIFSTGCEKYLDIKKTSSQGLLETLNDVQKLLDTYSMINNTVYPNDGQLSCDDFYVRGETYIASNITQEDKDVYTWQVNPRTLALPQWQSPYQVVYLSNLALETLDKIKSNDASFDIEKSNGLRGAALFYRSFAFWNLAQIYCKPYDKTGSNLDLGIPLRLSSDINSKSNRGTVQQVYERILIDLNAAVSLLPIQSIVASRPNKAAAYAMLARTYLSMENYSQALESCNEALKLKSDLLDYNTLSQTSSTPFQRFNIEVLFHSTMSPNTLLAPGSQTNPTAIIASDIAASYSVNDLRSKLFLKENQSRKIDPSTGDYFKNSSGVALFFPDGTYRFSGNYEQANSAVLFNGLAVDELYLIRSECQARANNFIQAMTDLNTLLKKRWVTGTYIDKMASNADEALNIILNERRKELIMRGQRWTDLRRLNRDDRFKKSLKRIISFAAVPNAPTPSSISYELPPNDQRYTLQIPQEVITNSGLPQNPK